MLKIFTPHTGLKMINLLIIFIYIIFSHNEVAHLYGKFSNVYLFGFSISYLLLCWFVTPKVGFKYLFIYIVIIFASLTIGYIFVSAQFFTVGGHFNKISFVNWFFAATFLNYFSSKLVFLLALSVVGYIFQQYILKKFIMPTQESNNG